MYNNDAQKRLEALWDAYLDQRDLGRADHRNEAYDVPSTRNGWAWMQLVEFSPFRVEQGNFPKENSGHVLQGPTPCTDGETLWIPRGSFDSQSSFLFHEMAHAFLHYPNGRDAGLLDPANRRDESVWEFEACLVASQVLRALGLVDSYNKSYMRNWYGEHGDINLQKVTAVASRIISRYMGMRAAEETKIGGR